MLKLVNIGYWVLIETVLLSKPKLFITYALIKKKEN